MTEVLITYYNGTYKGRMAVYREAGVHKFEIYVVK
jgi:hypothetical protein